jgi:ABC-type transport system involved in multi-copper enzyme maturation permease subunit
MRILRRFFLPWSEKSGRGRLAALVFVQELRTLMAAPALWIMLVVITLLVGYSFIEAVELYGRASRTALSHAELASGLNPMDGVFIPTFGAYYLTETLLLPFIAIRIIGRDRQDGTLKLMFQLQLSSFVLGLLKLAALGCVWLFSLLPALSVLFCWYGFGGHLPLAGIALLCTGHALYALVVVTLAMFAAALSGNPATAAIFTLGATLASWVLDFAATGSAGILRQLAGFSLTGMLRQLEQGLLATPQLAVFLGLSALFFILCVLWLHPGRRPAAKLSGSALVLLLIGLFLVAAFARPAYRDLTEDRRHSFPPALTAALRGLDRTLVITIHLDPLDSRLQDLERDLFAKLKRSVKKLELRYAVEGREGLFATAEIDNYGLLEYEYSGRHDRSYSNSAEEIVPLILKLAGREAAWRPGPVYPGYPLVADTRKCRWWFYLVLPLIFLFAGICGCRGRVGFFRIKERVE